MSHKVIKKTRKILFYSGAFLFGLVLTVYSVVRTPGFQTLSGRLLANYLSDKLKTQVRIDRVRISDMLTMKLTGVYLEDLHGKPLLTAGKLSLRFSGFRMRQGRIHLADLTLADAGFSLVTYKGENSTNIQFVLDYFKGPVQKDDTLPGKKWTLNCNKLSLDRVNFSLDNENVPPIEEGMDYAHLAISGIHIEAEEMAVHGDTISAIISNLHCEEKSGFRIKRMKAAASVSSRGMHVKGLEVETDNSELFLDLAFNYNEFSDFDDFLNKVIMKADIQLSHLNMKDIGYFAPVLKVMNNELNISGNVDGPVSDLTLTNFGFSFGEATGFLGNIHLKGIPQMDSAFFELKTEAFTFNARDIESFALPIDGVYLSLPALLDTLGNVSMQLSCQGYYNNFTATGKMQTGIGNLDFDTKLHSRGIFEDASYHAELTARDLNVGKIVEYTDIGTMSMEVELEGKGLSADSMKMVVNGWIKDLEFRNRFYDKIIFGGALTNKSFDGRLIVNDSLVNLDFEGLVDFKSIPPRFNFTAKLDDAKLYEMNLSHRSPDMRLKTSVTADFTGINLDDFTGKLTIDSTVYVEDKISYSMKHLELNDSILGNGTHHIILRSDFVDADILKQTRFSFILPQIKQMVLEQKDTTRTIWSDSLGQGAFAYFVTLRDTKELTRLILPQLSISPNSVIKGNFDFGQKTFTVQGHSGGVSYQGIWFVNLVFDGSYDRGSILLDAGAGQLLFNGSEPGDSLALGLDSLNLHAAWLNDSLSYSLSWNDMLHTEMNAGHISGFVELSAPGRFEAGIRNASAIVNGNKWSIGKGNHLVIDTTFITVTDLVFNGPGQEFRVDGTLSKKYSDTLSVDFKNWQLSNFDPLIGDESLVVHGTINGRLNLSNYVSPRIFADLDIAGLVFAGTGLGDMQINTHWNNQDNALLIDAKLFGEGSRDVSKVLDIQGYYYPFNKTSNFDVNIRAKNMKLAPAGPFLSVFMSGLKGLASGDLHLGGTWKKLELTGQLHLQRTEFVIDYLKTKYSLSHDIFFEKSRIYFHDLVLYDTLNNKAICNGELTHNYFRDLALDLDIRPEKILAVNLDRYQNSIFYGKAFATGEVRITGPLDDIDLQVSATTNSGTKIFIPINYSVDLSQSDFIIFKNLADTLTKPEEYKTVVKGLNLNFDLNVTRDAEIQLFLPGNMGFIRASGEGGLFMGIDPRGYFTIYGSYAIRSGQFQFSLQSLISKRFDITEGSRIKWSGDIYDAEVNITAKYKLKTTLSGLGITMIDEQATSQKVNVNCIIRMTGNLFNPDLGFSIEFPSLNEQTKQAVYAILDTNDAALMNQQAISLLVLNSFSTAGTTVGSPITSTSVLTNTLSSWLSQISNDFDVGINYVPGDAVSQEEVGVALSTQLFDERLTIDGNLDVSNSKSTQKSSSIVGDVNIEYRLTTDGRFRVKAFNRANNVSILQESSPYTQGVGVFYRKEFDNFKDFFKKKKKNAPVEP